MHVFLLVRRRAANLHRLPVAELPLSVTRSPINWLRSQAVTVPSAWVVCLQTTIGLGPGLADATLRFWNGLAVWCAIARAARAISGLLNNFYPKGFDCCAQPAGRQGCQRWTALAICTSQPIGCFLHLGCRSTHTLEGNASRT